MTDQDRGPVPEPAGAAPAVAAGGLAAGAKAGLLLALLLLAFVALRYTEAGASLSKERIQVLVSGLGPLAPAAHVALFAVGTTALVPATFFALIGAVVFGKLLGSFYNLAGATGGAALSFLAARYLGRDFAGRWVTGKLRDLDARAERHGFSLICYLRLAYFPFAPLNYAAGLTRIRFLDYLCGTVIGILPGMLIITSFLDELTNLGSAADLLTRRFLVPLTLFTLSWCLPMLVKRLVPGLNSTAASRRA